jgi:hypothetical protein
MQYTSCTYTGLPLGPMQFSGNSQGSLSISSFNFYPDGILGLISGVKTPISGVGEALWNPSPRSII